MHLTGLLEFQHCSPSSRSMTFAPIAAEFLSQSLRLGIWGLEGCFIDCDTIICKADIRAIAYASCTTTRRVKRQLRSHHLHDQTRIEISQIFASYLGVDTGLWVLSRQFFKQDESLIKLWMSFGPKRDAKRRAGHQILKNANTWTGFISQP